MNDKVSSKWSVKNIPEPMQRQTQECIWTQMLKRTQVKCNTRNEPKRTMDENLLYQDYLHHTKVLRLLIF